MAKDNPHTDPNTPQGLICDPDGPAGKEACEDAKVHRERYRVFIEEVADGFYETDLKGNFTFFNNALCRIFGYSRKAMQGRNFRQFMTEQNAKTAFDNVNRVYTTGKGITDIIWRIISKDGETRVLEISANLILDESGNKAGFRGIARDVTVEKQAARTNQALYQIATALHRFRLLDERLAYIIEQIRHLIGVEGASVILVDQDKKEFFFRATSYDDSRTSRKMKEIRFPLDKGIAGTVYRTGKPIIVSDVYQHPDFLSRVDEQAGYKTKNMLDVPIWTQNRLVGVLCAVNKKEGSFDTRDVELLSTIANTVAFPIENARINEALNRSYREVRSLNKAKDSIIHHLSHELKTPVSVLSATLSLLDRKLGWEKDDHFERILTRAQRNLDRILEMQYQIEDIIQHRDYTAYHMLSPLLAACTDELEALLESELLNDPSVMSAGRAADIDQLVNRVRQRIDRLFGPRDATPEKIHLDVFVKNKLAAIEDRFAHRRIDLVTRLEPVPSIWIPEEVLSKTVVGLIRNAVENTPDHSRIEIEVSPRRKGPVLIIKDFGAGITEEKKHLIFENYFVYYDTKHYSTKNPYDFNAGGKGFDLLRLKIFSEQYHFSIQTTTTRCGFIPRDEDRCPGDVDRCRFCKIREDCLASGGTTVRVWFTAGKNLLEKTAQTIKNGSSP